MKDKLLHFLRRFPFASGVGLIAIILLVILGLRYSVLPDAEQLLDEVQRDVTVMTRNIENGRNLEEQAAQLSEWVELVESRVIRRQDRAINSAYFYDFENRVPIAVTGLVQREDLPGRFTAPRGRNVTDPWALQTFEEISFQMEAVGRLNELLHLLYLLRTADKLLRLGNFSLGIDQAVNPAVLKLEIDLRVLARKP